MGICLETREKAMHGGVVGLLVAVAFAASACLVAAAFPGYAYAEVAENPTADSSPSACESVGEGNGSPAPEGGPTSADVEAPACDLAPDAPRADGDAGGAGETVVNAPEEASSHDDGAATTDGACADGAPVTASDDSADAKPVEPEPAGSCEQGGTGSANPGDGVGGDAGEPQAGTCTKPDVAARGADEAAKAQAPARQAPAANSGVTASPRSVGARAASAQAVVAPKKAAPKRAAAVVNLKRGLYLLAADAKRTLVVAVSGNSKASGANVRILKADGKTSQLWWILRAPKAGGAYIIESAHGGNVLEVAGGSKASGANVRVAACRNSGEQLWVPVGMTGGLVGFKNVKTGMMLGIAGGGAVAGANVVQTRALSAKAAPLSPVKVAAKSDKTDLGRALASLRAKGVVVSGLRWAGSAGMPVGAKRAVTARAVAITGSAIAPQLVQRITLSPSYLLKGASNPQAAFDRITAAIKREGSTSGNVLYRVVLPRGTYKTKGTMHVYSNTWIDLTRGTTFKRAFRSGCMLRNGTTSTKASGYGLSRNIVIQGGMFDANVRAGFKSASSTIRLGHCRNVLVKGVAFYQAKTHMVELSGVRDATVAGCAFKDNGTMRQWSEAIQIECVSTKKAASGFAPYDYTPCQNIVVERNRFTGVNRGVGNHSAILGRYDNRVLVRGNAFAGLVNEAVDFPAVRHFIITGNRISRCGAGVAVQSTHPLFHLARKGVAARVIPAAYGEIRDNAITTAKRGVQVAHSCISLVGATRGKAVYHLSHITLSGNRVKSCKGAAIVARYVRASTVNGRRLAVGARDVRLKA